MLQKVINISVNSFRRQNFRVMKDKLLARVKERRLAEQELQALAWCREHAESYEDFIKNLDQKLWIETLNVQKTIKQNADKKLKDLGLDLGGGGNYPMLYFFTRYLCAKTVVETGVAAGWSSQAILTALKVNNEGGKLFSSDFPYFRYKNPERFVGYIVDESSKENWNLYIDGDQNNLPKIASLTECIDLFHYDSDKSYAGRAFALEIFKEHLSGKSTIIFDDIQDNFHFKEYVQKNDLKFKIFEFEKKYVGLIAPFL